MFEIKGVCSFWFDKPKTRNCAFVYDLDDTLLFRKTSEAHLVPLDKRQTDLDDMYILTYRPAELKKETLKDLNPIKQKITCVFTRDSEIYPFEKSDVDTFKYKIGVLKKICKIYKTVYFFENKAVIVSGVAGLGISNLICYLVSIVINDGVEMVIKTKIRKEVV